MNSNFFSDPYNLEKKNMETKKNPLPPLFSPTNDRKTISELKESAHKSTPIKTIKTQDLVESPYSKKFYEENQEKGTGLKEEKKQFDSGSPKKVNFDLEREREENNPEEKGMNFFRDLLGEKNLKNLKQSENIQDLKVSKDAPFPSIVNTFLDQDDVRKQLPHKKEAQKHNVLTRDEVKSSVFPKYIESRTNFQEDKSVVDRGFYNEGFVGTKDPPKKVQFNIDVKERMSNVNPFASGINIEEYKQNATFSRHIFEDKTIIEVLEKKSGVKPVNDDLYDSRKVTGRRKDTIREKKGGRVVIEKGVHHSDPYSRFSHVLFKILSILAYFSLSTSSSTANLVYESVIILSALDFWVVKNLSARLLIGYRYWCEFTSSGKEKWVFETYCERNVKENKINTRFFWISQTAFTTLWFICAVYELFQLKVAMVICLAWGFGLCFANLMIYRRCEQIKKSNMDELFVQMSQLDKTLYMIRGSIKLPLFKNKPLK